MSGHFRCQVVAPAFVAIPPSTMVVKSLRHDTQVLGLRWGAMNIKADVALTSSVVTALNDAKKHETRGSSQG